MAERVAELAAALDCLIGELSHGELLRANNDDVSSVVTEFERVRNRMALVDQQLVAAVEASTLDEELVLGSTAGVIAVLARVSKLEATRRVAEVEVLGSRPSMTGETRPAQHERLAALVSTGDVPAENTRIAVSCLRRLERRYLAGPEQLASAEGHLLEAVAVFTPEEVRRVARTVEDVLFPDGCLASEAEVADARFLTLRPKRDGSYLVEGRLTGLCGAALSAVITSLAAPMPGPDGSPDDRTAAQRRHDALHTAATLALRTDDLPRAGGVPASIIVTISARDLSSRTGHGETSDGGLLSAAEVARLTDEAELLPTIFDGKGAVLKLGRTRRCATESQTKALIARDGGCSFPSCQAPPAWCDRHHVIPWRDDGPTDVANLTLVCGYHHGHFERQHWRCCMIDGLPHWIPPRWVDRRQTPILHGRIRARLLAESASLPESA